MKKNVKNVLKILLFSLINSALTIIYFRVAYSKYCDYVTKYSFDCNIFLGLTMGIWVFITSIIILGIFYMTRMTK